MFDSSNTVQVILGKTTKNNEGITLQSKFIKVHPDYKENVELHNLAVVEIPSAPLSRKHIWIN